MSSGIGSDTEVAAPEPTIPSANDPTFPRATRSAWLTHSGWDVAHYISMHMLGAVFPLSAGLLLYGWRAMLLIGFLCISTALALALWRRVGRRGRQVRYDHAMWLALLLALTLPPHLLSGRDMSGFTDLVPWPIIPAAGITLAILLWAMGGSGSGRVHAVLIAHLLIVVLFNPLLVPHYTLQRMNLFRGDVLNASIPPSAFEDGGDTSGETDVKLPWIRHPVDWRVDAIYSEPASQRLVFYTTGTESPERSWLSLETLLRDRMPPLEDLIIGGQPGPIGTSSAIAVIIGGLFMLYRGVIDYRIPLLIFVSAYICMLFLPVPVRITETDKTWQWLVVRSPPDGVGWRVALTFVHYELMASPLMFTAFFMATAPSIRPMSRQARAIYAVLIGGFAAVFQLYLSVAIGAYLSLLMISLLTPVIDNLFRPRTLV